MTFFRIKKIKGKEYGYIVENLWGNRGSRQKVKGYLGRIFRFNLSNEPDFLQFLKLGNLQDYIENRSIADIIKNLVEWELSKYNVDITEFSINLQDMTLRKNDKNVAFAINDGFMCSMTLKNLSEFKPEGDEETDGYRFARAFVEAGIKVPQEIFVGLFGKIYKTREEKG